MGNFNFITKFPQKWYFPFKAKKKERAHQIQHIRNSLSTKFQFKETILNFWINFTQKSKCYLNIFYYKVRQGVFTYSWVFFKKYITKRGKQRKFHEFQINYIIGKKLLQSVTGSANRDNYYKVRRNTGLLKSIPSSNNWFDMKFFIYLFAYPAPFVPILF